MDDSLGQANGTPRFSAALAGALLGALAAFGQEGRWPPVVTWRPDERAVKSGLYIAPRPPAARQRVSFTVAEPSGVPRRDWPVRGAIPPYRGELAEAAKIHLLDEAGNLEPWKVVDHSRDGWAHITVDDFRFDGEVMTQSPETKPRVTPSVAAVGKPTRAPNEDESVSAPGRPSLTSMRFSTQKVAGIGHEPGVCRRDPSDVIKVGDTYYVWYSKVARGQRLYPSGYAASVWCATSTDEGRSWTERGEAVGRGPKGTFDSHGVFTPNILAHGGKYYLYYTAVGNGFTNRGYSEQGKTRIAVAVSDSPDGPWTKPENNVVIEPSKDKSRFDSFRCDDSALLVHEGKIWLYYKGRQWGRTPKFTKMGLAVATGPLGPFVKQNDGEPVQPEGHEVLIWTEGDGVVSLVTSAGRGVYYSTDRLRFRKIASGFTGKLMAPGAYRRDLTDPRDTSGLRWGIAMVPGKDPYLVRFVRAIGSSRGMAGYSR